MREIRQSGSEGGEPQLKAAFLPLSLVGCVYKLALISLSRAASGLRL